MKLRTFLNNIFLYYTFYFFAHIHLITPPILCSHFMMVHLVLNFKKEVLPRNEIDYEINQHNQDIS